MKGNLKKSVLFILLLAIVFSTFGCGFIRKPDNNDEQIDSSRTQLYVYNFYGGYGSDWLSAAKSRYELLHKDDVYETGKKGVQIYINNQKASIMGIRNQILDNRDEIYFTEYAYYDTLKSDGLLGDISEAVTAPLTEYGETRSIKDKLTAEQDAYYGIKTDGGVHYYGIPHYAGYSGLIYNVDLFDEEGYYFAKTPSGSSLEEQFIDKLNQTKSAGTDGEFGTSDDGLPATYEEFFKLCDFIASSGSTPIAWNGADYKHYLNNLLKCLCADYDGIEQMMLNYTLNGTATSLASIVNGNLVIDAPTQINEDNAYKLTAQAGRYYGLKFLEKLVKTDKYHNDLAFNGGYSHMNAQEDFLQAGKDGKTKPIAMLCDGAWWEMEAKQTFIQMEASKGEAYNKYNRKFGFMPLPKATQEKANVNKTNGADAKKLTLFDEIYSLCFMKSNIAEWKKPLALDFIKFVNTNESLTEFTSITNTVKALDYSMTEEQKSKLSPFGKSLIEIKAKADIVYPFSTNKLYANNQTFFMTHESFRSTVDGGNKQWPSEALGEGGISAEDYFSGMVPYYKSVWNTLVK